MHRHGVRGVDIAELDGVDALQTEGGTEHGSQRAFVGDYHADVAVGQAEAGIIAGDQQRPAGVPGPLAEFVPAQPPLAELVPGGHPEPAEAVGAQDAGLQRRR